MIAVAMARPRSFAARALALALLAVVSACSPAGRDPAVSADATAGHLLVANREMQDPHFAETVVYIVAHDRDGAFGVVVNRVYDKGSLQALFEALGLPIPPALTEAPLHYGGPVQPERGFVLHSPDYSGEGTIELNRELSFSSGRDVLEAIAAGDGPKQALIVLGYAGWAPGQLDAEIARGSWLIAPLDRTLIFSDQPQSVWEQALQHAGIPL